VVRRENEKALIGARPLEQMRQVVADYSCPDELVCDPCAGSGTTGIAARALGRRVLLIERDDERVQLVRERVSYMPEAGGQQAVLAW
jgi:DNA modification methylase